MKFLQNYIHNISFFTESSAKTGLNVQNIFIEAAKILYIQHEEIKNRISRPGSWSATISVQDELRLSAKIMHRRLPSTFNENNTKEKEILKTENKKQKFFTTVKKEPKKFGGKKYICKITTVGKNIKDNQLKIIIDSCIKSYLQLEGKVMTANKAANLIKKLIGDNWLVFISKIDDKDFDFCL